MPPLASEVLEASEVSDDTFMQQLSADDRVLVHVC
jgi:hypothetical protein